MEQHPENNLNKPQDTAYHIALASIFVISIVLRLGLSLVNHEANDDHVEVAVRIFNTGILPTKIDCWECFQPKLFTFTLAGIYRIFGITNLSSQILSAQMVNLLAGIFILFITWAFLNQLPFQNKAIKLLGFSLTALNPKLIAINSQATNDTFIIFFSTLALYYIFVHLKEKRAKPFFWAVLFTSLAIASKTNGWVTFLAITVALLINIRVQASQRTGSIFFACVFIISVPVLTVINPLTQYISNYKMYGSPILNNIETLPFPYFFEKTSFNRPGLLSIQDGLFTFKFSELIRHPRIEKRTKPYPRHENSLWTQFYGQAHSATFDNWPPSWRSSGEEGFLLRRVSYYLALIPTGILILGAALESISLLWHLFKNGVTDQILRISPIIIAFWGFVVFVMIYAVEYRDFSVMKIIFTYPAILAFPMFFISGTENLFAGLKQPQWLIPFLTIIIAPLLFAYIMDLSTLVIKLYQFLV